MPKFRVPGRPAVSQLSSKAARSSLAADGDSPCQSVTDAIGARHIRARLRGALPLVRGRHLRLRLRDRSVERV